MVVSGGDRKLPLQHTPPLFASNQSIRVPAPCRPLLHRLRPMPPPIALWLIAATSLLAEGTAPLAIDDPGTPGPGRWEINVGAATERRPGSQLSALPVLDFNYGLGESVQIKWEVPWLAKREGSGDRVSGLGHSVLGAKWRFFQASSGRSVSIAPTVEFDHPGSSSSERGLVERGTVLTVPIQFERAWSGLAVNVEAGHEFGPDASRWSFGAALRRRLHARCEIAAEIIGSCTARLDQSRLAANLCVAIDVGDATSLMLSAGRELHNHEEARATLVGYVGWQLRL